MGTVSHTLAEFVARLRPQDLPDGVVRAATRHIIDTAGVSLAAAGRGAATPAIDMVRSWSGAREATVIGHDFGAPAPAAALANGALAHALEYDDTHVESVVNPSSFAVPAAFAVAEEVGASGARTIAAVVAGYEVATRMGAAAPGRFQARGQDATGICGTIGAAAVAGLLWELTPEQIEHAFGIAASQSAGLFAAADDASPERALHAGWAAHAGIVAADLARRGFPGPSTVFDGPHSLFDALLTGEEPSLERMSRGLGDEWETTRIALKPHAACHFLHALMDAAAASGVKWADVDEIICSIPPSVARIVAEPRAERLRPPTTEQARYSLPFAVASSIVGGRTPLDAFGPEALADRRILTLAERVHHVADPTLRFPQSYGGRLRIHTRGGRTIEHDEPVQRGHPDRPLPDDDVDGKFLANARMRVDRRAAERALESLRSLWEAPSAAAVAETLRLP